jgi:hypothetical protein
MMGGYTGAVGVLSEGLLTSVDVPLVEGIGVMLLEVVG